MTVRLGWYGDDFTGATDTLAVAAQAGWRSLLFLGVPTDRHRALAGELDALGIAGSARAMSPERMARELAPVGEYFRGEGVSVLLYKCCSTFDSSPDVGSLGAAMAALRPYVGVPTAFIVGGQPGIGRYCCFSNLFAAVGAGGEVSRIDRHPTMKNHPVTPMNEGDLRLHLGRQGVDAVAAVHYPDYQLPEAQQDARVDALLCTGQAPDAVLFDVAQALDLAHVGRQIARRSRAQSMLAVGPSSVFQALSEHERAQGRASARIMPRPGRQGREGAGVFVFAGSMSPITADQVRHAHSYARVSLRASDLLENPAAVDVRLNTIRELLDAGRHVLAYVRNGRHGSDGSDGAPAADRIAAAPGELAAATADFVGRVVRRQAQAGRPLRRLGIAGGDTSSLAVQGLGIWALAFDGVLAPGVTLCRAHSDDARLHGLPVMLKGGQMGPVDIFERFLARSDD